MSEVDFVLLTVYFLCVSYVLYQIVNSFNDEFTIRLEEEDLAESLKVLHLQDTVQVGFRFNYRYEFGSLKVLALRLKNISTDAVVYIDWDQCILTNHLGRSRRLTRIPAGNTLDMMQSQPFSVLAPGKVLMEEIAGEDQLTREGEKLPLTVTKPIIDLSKPDRTGASEAIKKRYRDFMASKTNLEFDIEFAVRVADPQTPAMGYPTRIPCKFSIIKLDWTAGLPWNPRVPLP